MMALAHFYGWSLFDIKRMNMRDIDEAAQFMAEQKKREAQSYGK